MARTLVAVNGLGGLAYLWEVVAAELSPDVELQVLDLPGHGQQPPAADYRYPAMVEQVAEQTAGVPAFALAGWSVGGAVAWMFAARHPDRVTHLVLLDPASPHQNPFRHGPVPEPVHAFTYASVDKAMAALRFVFPGVTEADVRALYVQNVRGRWEPRHDPAILPALVVDARDHGEEIFFELERITVPVLLLRGERSFLRRDQVEEIASAIPDVIVEEVPGAGHFLVREQPQRVAASISAFLQSASGRSNRHRG